MKGHYGVRLRGQDEVLRNQLLVGTAILLLLHVTCFSGVHAYACDSTKPCVIALGGVYEIENETNADGSGSTAGEPCGNILYYINKTINEVNNMNGGLGFLVNSSVNSANERDMFFKMNFTYDTYLQGQWKTHGARKSRALFSKIDFIIGQGAGCSDADIIRQAALATNMSKIYFTNRGPPSVLDSIASLTGGTSDQYAFSIHLSSDLYPESILARSILRGYEKVSVITENSSNYFFTGVGLAAMDYVEDSPSLSLESSLAFNYDNLDSDSIAQQIKNTMDQAASDDTEILILSMRGLQWDAVLRKLTELRDTHSFKVVWSVAVPWSSGTCLGTGDNCSYVVGATQFWHQEERWTDDILEMDGLASGLAFNYQSGLNDGWRLDVCSEITLLAQAVRRVLTWKNLGNGSSVFSESNMAAIRENIASGTSARKLTDVNGNTVKISDGPFNTFWGPVEFNARGQNEGREPTTVQFPRPNLMSSDSLAVNTTEARIIAGDDPDFDEAAWITPVPASDRCPDEGTFLDGYARFPRSTEDELIDSDELTDETSTAWADGEWSKCPLCHFHCGDCPAHSRANPTTESCDCVEGYYKVGGDFRDGAYCQVCPHGMMCAGGTALPCPLAGYWADMTSFSTLEDGAIECFAEDNCLGGAVHGKPGPCFLSEANLTLCVSASSYAGKENSGTDYLCEKGSKGYMCDKCESGYFYNVDQGCLNCRGAGSVTGTLVSFFIIVAVIVVALIASKVCRWIRYTAWWLVFMNPARFKIVWATAQIIATISWATGVTWPQPFRTMAEILALLELNFLEVLPAGCVASVKFYDQLLMATLVPPAFILLINACSMLSFVSRGIAIYLSELIAFCVLPSTSLMLFRVFDCVELPDGTRWLVADVNSSCESQVYSGWLVYTSLFLFVYPFGVPLTIYCSLRRKRHAIALLDRTKRVPPKLSKYEFLFVDYSSDYWHGETVRSIMRVVLSGLVVTFSRNPNVRSFCGIALSYACVEVARAYQPFLQVTNNAIATAAQYQILFTYCMAFILTDRPFNTNLSAIAWLLILANFAVFAFAFKRARIEFDRHQELKYLQAQTVELAENLLAFQKSLVNVVAVARPMGKDRIRFLPGGDWCQSASKEALEAAAKNIELDLIGLEDKEDVLRKYLEVASIQKQRCETVLWYWQEDNAKLGVWQDIYDNKWIRYADNVAAELEYSFMRLKEADNTGIVEVDVNGRVRGRRDGARDIASKAGTKYEVDLHQMKQINAATGYKRNVLRRVEQDSSLGAPMRNSSIRRVSKMDFLDANDGAYGSSNDQSSGWIASLTNKFGGSSQDDQVNIDDEDIPAFPAEFVDQRTGELKEPLLRLRLGQLIQVQKQRDDGWHYGFVIFDSATDGQDNDTSLVSKLRELDEKRKAANNRLSDQKASVGNVVDGFVQHLIKGDESPDLEEKEADDDSGGVTSGWFPAAFMRAPSPLELAAMQACLQQASDHDDNGLISDPLAPPDNWATKDNPDPLHPKIVDLAEDDPERSEIEEFFKASLRETLADLKVIKSVKRIESIGLWQSFVTKKRQLQTRAKAEGHDEAYAEAYEKVWMFHGTVPDVIPKICGQGFNRSFCGRNAVKYGTDGDLMLPRRTTQSHLCGTPTNTCIPPGKGVYFATNSFYSNRYSQSDSKGIKRMFLCRVAVGEYHKGRDGQIAPDERIPNKHILYDSTTDNMSDAARDMFVVFHDAQAYPEYLLEYSTETKTNN